MFASKMLHGKTMDGSKERWRISKAISKKTFVVIILNLRETKCTKWLKKSTSGVAGETSVELPSMLSQA